MIQGTCHCGNIQLSIPKLTETGITCTCSICSRYSTVWGHFTEADVKVTVGDKGMSAYCHGDKLINFNRCNECGCITHYTSTQPNPESRLSVNYRMFPASTLKELTLRIFDGADTWEFLD